MENIQELVFGQKLKEKIEKLEAERNVCRDMADMWNKRAGAAMGRIIELRKSCKHDFESLNTYYVSSAKCKICDYVGVR